jgi:hypothetical protein
MTTYEEPRTGDRIVSTAYPPSQRPVWIVDRVVDNPQAVFEFNRRIVECHREDNAAFLARYWISNVVPARS